jgi:hypothetical protein
MAIRPFNLARAVPPTGRRIRSPSHPFAVRHRPYQIQPFFIAPVLPGETMKNMLLQSRVVSDPVKNPLGGWWIEYYFFYVKHRDLNIRDDLTEMMLDVNKDMSSFYETANAKHHHFGGTINWSARCLERVTEVFFRNEGENWDEATIDGLPLAHAVNNQVNWLDSVVNDADIVLPNDDVDTDADGVITAREVAHSLTSWRQLVHAGLTEQTYEDWLATYGVKVAPEATNEPELVRFVKQWSYPTNIVDPTTGVPTSALSWSVAERADKDRFLREPGFLFGVTVARPKVFLRTAGSAVGLMNSALTWLPALMRDDPWTSMLQVDQGAGPLPHVTDEGGYWVDLKDLLLYGDQFHNFDIAAEGDSGYVAVPTATMQKRFVTATDIDALFSGTNKRFRQDGIVTCGILGHQTDTSLPT